MDFDEALQDIFCIPRMLGTFPFDSHFSLSIKCLFYSFILRFLSFCGALLGFINSSSVFDEDVEEGSIGLALRSIAVLSAFSDNFFTLFWWILKRHRITFLMESINAMQKRQKVVLDRQRVRFVHYLLFSSAVTSIASYSICTWKQKSLINIINEFSYYLSFSSTMCFVGQFWDLLHLLGYLFRMCTQMYDDSSVINYERFLALSEMINEIYGLQVLFTITKCFIQIIVYFYILLLPMYPGFSFLNILIIIHAINCIIPVGAIVLACNYYINQVICLLYY
ncbi:uncharacterized protein [Halyomorpha halys]|uniref:uncharacterized protein n=1 Tax=Halyomorpha halys TaxID=286706 RepID=UPI0034D256EF